MSFVVSTILPLPLAVQYQQVHQHLHFYSKPDLSSLNLKPHTCPTNATPSAFGKSSTDVRSASPLPTPTRLVTTDQTLKLVRLALA